MIKSIETLVFFLVLCSFHLLSIHLGYFYQKNNGDKLIFLYLKTWTTFIWNLYLTNNSDNFESINSFSMKSKYRELSGPIGRLDLKIRKAMGKRSSRLYRLDNFIRIHNDESSLYS